MKNKTRTIAIVFIELIIITGALYFIRSYKSVDEMLLFRQAAINAKCPYMIDNVTRMDSAVVEGERHAAFYYTLTTKNNDSVRVDIDELRLLLAGKLINWAKNSSDAQFFRENGITISHTYRDKKGLFLMTEDVTPEKYLNHE